MTDRDREVARRWQEVYDAFFQTVQGGFSERLGSVIEDLDLDARTILVRFRTDTLMANPMGTVHGGVIAGMADTAAGMLSKALIGDWIAGPTVSLSVNYLRPVPLGASVWVRARCQKSGRFLNYTTCEGYLAEAPDEALFTGECVYFSAVEAGKSGK
ncbi:MAG: PaaI family thioesterase [Oscillospiraceae bacterium]|nr:PaaI family thioesterase [Oscillospiraceae bacterium]